MLFKKCIKIHLLTKFTFFLNSTMVFYSVVFHLIARNTQNIIEKSNRLVSSARIRTRFYESTFDGRRHAPIRAYLTEEVVSYKRRTCTPFSFQHIPKTELVRTFLLLSWETISVLTNLQLSRVIEKNTEINQELTSVWIQYMSGGAVKDSVQIC